MSKNFRGSFCDPFKPEVIELGDIRGDKVVEKFDSILWGTFLSQMQTAREEDIFYSPSLEIENKDSQHGLTISAVGEPGKYEFYVFYKRPKTLSTFFGLKKRINKNYTSDKIGFTKQDVVDCLEALLRDDTQYLADKIGH